MKPSLSQITLAVFNEQEMQEFYSEVFDIELIVKEYPDFKLYEGDWNGMTLLLCPAEIAKNTATQNRHQFHVEVDDIEKFFANALDHGASILEQVEKNDSGKSGSLSDPDGNSIVVSEYRKKKLQPSITGIGGIFFKCENPEKLKMWYEKHLGIPTGQYGLNFAWGKENGNGYTLWSPFPQDTKYFQPSEQEYMVNFRVSNLDDLLEELKSKGIKIEGEEASFAYGQFAWILDVEGNKIELWEPNDHEYEKIIDPVITSN
jgi:predicted enzyme related to lactoylglutathione lyase